MSWMERHRLLPCTCHCQIWHEAGLCSLMVHVMCSEQPLLHCCVCCQSKWPSLLMPAASCMPDGGDYLFQPGQRLLQGKGRLLGSCFCQVKSCSQSMSGRVLHGLVLLPACCRASLPCRGHRWSQNCGIQAAQPCDLSANKGVSKNQAGRHRDK